MVIHFLLILQSVLIGTPPVLVDHYYTLSSKEFFALPEANQIINPEEFDKDLLEAAVFFASNEVRIDKRKTAYSYSPILIKSSRLQSDYLLELGTLDHLNKDKNLRTPMMRIDHFGGDFMATAENLARLSIFQLPDDGRYYKSEAGEFLDQHGKPIIFHTYASMARKVVDGWMHSKGHRKNLMDDYNYLGCGVSSVVKSKNGVPEIYFTQNFGKK